MNSIETNAAAAIIAVLITDATLAAIPPVASDADTPTEVPRVVVKVQQGEEIVYRYGVYRLSCEVICAAVAVGNAADNYKARVVRKLLDNQAPPESPSTEQPIQVLLTTTLFHCFALEPSTASKGNTSDKRIQTVTFSLVGFDKSRYL